MGVAYLGVLGFPLAVLSDVRNGERDHTLFTDGHVARGDGINNLECIGKICVVFSIGCNVITYICTNHKFLN